LDVFLTGFVGFLLIRNPRWLPPHCEIYVNRGGGHLSGLGGQKSRKKRTFERILEIGVDI